MKYLTLPLLVLLTACETVPPVVIKAPPGPVAQTPARVAQPKPKVRLTAAQDVTTESESEPEIDVRCEPIAKYARAVAGLRDARVSLEDLSAFTSEPLAFGFPMQALRQDIFMRPELNGSQLYDRYYTMCTKEGYSALASSLKVSSIRFGVLKQATEDAKTPAQKKTGNLTKGNGKPDPRIISTPLKPEQPDPRIIAPTKK